MKGRKKASAWIVLALSLVLALAACGGQATDSPSVTERFEQGNEYAREGNFEQAITEYEAVLEAEPENVSAMTNLGVAYYNIGELEEAVAQYQKALEIAPNDADIHSNLGAAYVQQGRLQDALAEYQRAVDLQPDLAQAHFGLGVIYVELGRNDEAIAAFETFLELDEGQDSMASDLAQQYLQQRKGQSMYQLTRLDNGLRVLTVPMPHVQSVSIGIFMGVGSRYESEAISGTSHFIEHMVFKGTANWPTARDIAEAIEGKGGVFNASTGLESTLYWAKVAAAHLPEALGVLSDMLLRATFDPIEIEKERAVIGEEINYSRDAPDSLAQILANGLQWPNHPLGRDVAGTRETVASISRETLLDYRLDHYRPNTAILGLAGKISHAQALELAHKYLDGWEPGRTMTWEPAPPNGVGPNLQVAFKQTEQAHLILSFAGLSRDDPDRFVARLLNVILGEGMRSRLFQTVREELGLAYSVDSYSSTLQDTGAMGIYAGVATARSEEAVRAILDQLDQLRQEPVPQDELARAKEFIRGRLALSLEDSFAVATWYARQELLAAEVLEPQQVIEQLEAVQAQDVQRLARAIFRQEHLNLAAVGPFAENGDRFRQAIRF